VEAINNITWQIIGTAFKIHSNLGPGLFEKVYKECLFYELQKAGLSAKKEYSLPLVYGDVKLDAGYRGDQVS